MTITLTIAAENGAEFLSKFFTIANAMQTPGRPDPEFLKADAEARARGENLDGGPRRETVEVPPTETKRRAGRPPKVTAPVETPTESPKPVDGEVIPPEPAEITTDALRQALQNVSSEDKLGPEAAFKLLVDAGFDKVSTVPPEARAAIVDAAKALLKGV